MIAVPLRGWIALLVVVTFLAGFAGGLLAARRTAPAQTPVGAFAAYREMMTREFGLSVDRQRGLVAVLERYQRDLDELAGRQAEAFEPELARLGTKYKDLVRDHVLPAAQRARFDELAAATPPRLRSPADR